VIKKFSLTLLVLITFFTYLPSFWNQFLWDDEQFIYKNEYVKSFDFKSIITTSTTAGAGVASNYYRPLTTFTFALDHAVWGLRPFGFHLTNTVLHIGAGCVLYLLLRKLKFGNASWWLSALFLLHPLQSEAVTYVNSRGDSLFAFLSFLSVYCLVLALTQTTKTLTITQPPFTLGFKTWLVSCAAFFILSILAKELAVATIGLQILTTLWLKPKKAPAFAAWGLISLNAVFSAVYLYLRSTILNFGDSFNFYGTENEYTSSLLVRLLTFSKIVWTYLGLMVFPYPLHMERDSEIISTLNSLWPWLTLGLLASLAVIGWWEWRHRHRWLIWFGSLWFFGMLVPVSGAVPINGLLYEHWLYLPIVGFGIVIFGLIKLTNLQQILAKLHPQASTLLLIGLLGVGCLLTLRQNYLWRAPVPFYEYTLKYTNSARLHNNLGMAYADAGQLQLAIREYEAALRLSNSYPEIYHNLGNLYRQIGQLDQAETAYKQALTLSPGFEPSLIDLINIYLSQTKFDQALNLVNQLATKYPQNTEITQLQLQLQKEVPQ
jgi:hypothetical protein